jgi:hypothetical protein
MTAAAAPSQQGPAWLRAQDAGEAKWRLCHNTLRSSASTSRSGHTYAAPAPTAPLDLAPRRRRRRVTDVAGHGGGTCSCSCPRWGGLGLRRGSLSGGLLWLCDLERMQAGTGNEVRVQPIDAFEGPGRLSCVCQAHAGGKCGAERIAAEKAPQRQVLTASSYSSSQLSSSSYPSSMSSSSYKAARRGMLGAAPPRRRSHRC